ncbi:NAD(P)/FAD-dependent oxidoreductase [Psychrobacillus psychrodurans]|uniref:NAD(P)/FAD-dependent oxidoreductase n=1 Tax=Psychrobacillus psychrodurans TaxID=126157 RepID=UPI0008DF4F2C|nr:NAD(P)/FAD-dependent oxidoreductase [Psychrobacillus psychrodurans]MCZ8541236.1 NAD(P)/FAD-dependent oxidoreductase [Psychrobacillus psychrodurans]SFM88775.1 thioredoxin reductase (NADPH) [Psychrobacillus psychrodurans]
MNGELYDVTIIGGGPTGLFASFYGGLRDLKVKIIDSLPQLGGQLMELYPDKYIYDIGGLPKILAKDLVANLEEQAAYSNPTICLEETAIALEKLPDYFALTTDKNVHYSKTILLTSGIGSFQPRKLNVPGVAEYDGKNLHYKVKSLEAFRDSDVLVLGGGDSALDWSLMLEGVASKVTICHRREQFTAHEMTIQQLQNSSVEVKTPYGIKEVTGDGEKIQEVVIVSKDKAEERIAVDHVLVNYGNVASLGPLKEWGLEMEKNSVVVNEKMETSVEGIYAAGDVCTHDGKVKLIAVGFGEVPIAISHIKAFIDPKARVQPKHSTSIFEEVK